jgi:hypothetical protein
MNTLDVDADRLPVRLATAVHGRGYPARHGADDAGTRKGWVASR